MEHSVSGVGVLDKSVSIIACVQAGAATLAELTEATGLSRATTHRLAVALVDHGLLRRTETGQFGLGWRLISFGRAAEAALGIVAIAEPIVQSLRDDTGESAQLYLRDGNNRVCVASAESTHGLRTIVALGSILPIDKGSAGHALLGDTTREGWIESVAEREVGVASVSAPVCGQDGSVIAAIGVSGPIDRISRHPGAKYGKQVTRAARRLEAAYAPHSR